MTSINLPLKLALIENNDPAYRVAQRVGMPQSRLSMIVHGGIDAKPQERLKLAKILGKPESELFPENSERVNA